jgi:hypothetical protein
MAVLEMWATNFPDRKPKDYVIFDPDESAFNVHSPHHVAMWNVGHTLPEVWNGDRRSKKLEKLLFEEREIARRLRTSAGCLNRTSRNLRTCRHHKQVKTCETRTDEPNPRYGFHGDLLLFAVAPVRRCSARLDP